MNANGEIDVYSIQILQNIRQNSSVVEVVSTTFADIIDVFQIFFNNTNKNTNNW